MPRWARLSVTVVLVASLVVTEHALVDHDAVRTGVILAVAMALAAVWGIAAALPAAGLAGALLSGVPLSRDGLAQLAADTSTALTVAAAVALPLFTGTIATLQGQIGRHRAAADRAQYDPLTGLLNRVALEGHLTEWITARPAGSAPCMFAVLFVDLDRFKVVNDTYGHDVGDKLLCAIAQLLRTHVRKGDLVARLGGDEFVVAMPGLRDRQVAGGVARTLVALLSEPIDVDGGRSIPVSASIGIAVYPSDGADVSSLLGSADAAMYAVKVAGKNSFVFSNLRLRSEKTRRVEVESRLRMAVADQRLEIAYQPEVDLADRRIVAFEALLRWDDDVLGAVSPAEFVPIAEEAGLVVPIGHWLLREACHQLRAWDEFGSHDIGMAVNVSTLQFRQADFVDQVQAAVRDSRIAMERLEIEITESVLIDHFEVAVQVLRRLHRLGVRSALDDFGTGYSSLAYLHRLPIDALKIDRSFVSGLALSGTGAAGGAVPLVDAITAMGRTLGKTVVAEGVETGQQATYLRRIGVQRAQGFHFGRPVSAAAATTLIRRQCRSKGMAALEAERAARAGLRTDAGAEPRFELVLD